MVKDADYFTCIILECDGPKYDSVCGSADVDCGYKVIRIEDQASGAASECPPNCPGDNFDTISTENQGIFFVLQCVGDWEFSALS